MSDTPTAASALRPRSLAEWHAELTFKRETLVANIKAAIPVCAAGGATRGYNSTPSRSALPGSHGRRKGALLIVICSPGCGIRYCNCAWNTTSTCPLGTANRKTT